MWRAYFFLLLSCFCLSAVSPQEKWFLITESELQTIETQRQTWETNRQTWLQQVSELQAKVQTSLATSQMLQSKLEQSQAKSQSLITESANLNKALATERQTTQNLKKSFNLLEAEKSAQISSLSTENSTLVSTVKILEGKLSWWRLLAIGLLGAIILVVAFVILRKLGVLKI